MWLKLFSILFLVQVMVSPPSFGEGETTYQDCSTVQAQFKYDGGEKFCEVMAKCTKCFSGFRLACDAVATIPVWCRANGNSCPSAQACLDDNSLDQNVVNRLTTIPCAIPCTGKSSHAAPRGAVQ